MSPEVERILRKLKFGKPFRAHDVTIIHTLIDETRVSFCVDMENDPIQRNHRRGQFYEQKELNDLKGLFPEGGTFVDIGANVGNHSLFAALILKAGRVVPVEPNLLAFRLLINNVLINRLESVFDLTKLGVGLSDKAEDGYAMQKRERNLGGAKMLPGQGDLMVVPGDVLLADETPAMIKIDVEGMEMMALAGLEATIAKHKPILLVEVDNENEVAFFAWADVQGYRVEKTVQRYRLNKNHLLVPKTSALSVAKSADTDVMEPADATLAIKPKPKAKAKAAKKKQGLAAE